MFLFLVIFASVLLARVDIYFDEENPDRFYQVTKKTIVDTITWKIVKDFDFEVGRDSYESAIEKQDSVIVARGRKKLISFSPPLITETKLKLLASKGIVFVYETEPVKRKFWKIIWYYLFTVFIVPLFFLSSRLSRKLSEPLGGLIMIIFLVGALFDFLFVPEYNNLFFTISLCVLFILSIPAGYFISKLIKKKK